MIMEVQEKIGSALVLGGGIAGMQTTLDLASSGIKVYLADNKPSIGLTRNKAPQSTQVLRFCSCCEARKQRLPRSKWKMAV